MRNDLDEVVEEAFVRVRDADSDRAARSILDEYVDRFPEDWPFIATVVAPLLQSDLDRRRTRIAERMRAEPDPQGREDLQTEYWRLAGESMDQVTERLRSGRARDLRSEAADRYRHMQQASSDEERRAIAHDRPSAIPRPPTRPSSDRPTEQVSWEQVRRQVGNLPIPRLAHPPRDLVEVVSLHPELGRSYGAMDITYLPGNNSPGQEPNAVVEAGGLSLWGIWRDGPLPELVHSRTSVKLPKPVRGQPARIREVRGTTHARQVGWNEPWVRGPGGTYWTFASDPRRWPFSEFNRLLDELVEAPI